MLDIEKKIQDLQERLHYIQDIFGHRENKNISLLKSKLNDFLEKYARISGKECDRQLRALEDVFVFLENKLERQLKAMDKVRIVRHPQRISLKDILENVYDNYTEIGGRDECSIDPSMIIARAYITRRVGKKVHKQPVMVVGQEKGHGEEFRNGGSVKPWGNAKALRYMQVASLENIPVHTYIFTPGSYPIEDYPGAAQQIAKNLYEMAGLRVPVISIFSEGGSGGAEAIGLADRRIMLSHGYYSVISPEGAAAIEGRLKKGQKAEASLVDKCAQQLKITADDNRAMGYVDKVLKEPVLGARPENFDFFRNLRQEVIRATDDVVLRVKGVRFIRSLVLRKLKNPDIYVRWTLSSRSRERLVWQRYQKYRNMSRHAYEDHTPMWKKGADLVVDSGWTIYGFIRYDFLKRHQRKISEFAEEVHGEVHALFGRIGERFRTPLQRLGLIKAKKETSELTSLSAWDSNKSAKNNWVYISPQAKKDKAVLCPNSASQGCLDQWAPDLFGDFAGVCSYCGHHFSMEYEWYLYNVFDRRSIREFNSGIASGNPLNFDGFDLKLEEARKKVGHKCACMTFDASVKGVQMVVIMLMARFRGGSVGAAEGEKIIRAAERARKRHLPLFFYAHGTAGIRIQEGTNGVIQMPRCTMAIRRYLEAGGLYLVLYDTNSYAGPLASFLGCSPYQFAVRSSNIGFAGPGVIQETTGIEISPDYHRAYNALSRGHIQGIWDRREVRGNLYQALMTMGGRNIYYR